MLSILILIQLKLAWSKILKMFSRVLLLLISSQMLLVLSFQSLFTLNELKIWPSQRVSTFQATKQLDSLQMVQMRFVAQRY